MELSLAEMRLKWLLRGALPSSPPTKSKSSVSNIFTLKFKYFLGLQWVKSLATFRTPDTPDPGNSSGICKTIADSKFKGSAVTL